MARVHAGQLMCCLPGSPTHSQLWRRKASDQQPLSLCSVSIDGFRATTIITPSVRVKCLTHGATDCDKNCVLLGVLLDKTPQPCTRQRDFSPSEGSRYTKSTFPSFRLSMQEKWHLSSPMAATFTEGNPHLTLLQILTKQVGWSQEDSATSATYQKFEPTKGRTEVDHDDYRHMWITNRNRQHQVRGMMQCTLST